MHDALVEGIVVADDDLMERYLADEKLDVSELGHALAKGIDEATVFPVLCGSATKLIGVDRLARFIVEEGPEPHVTGDDGQTALFVFKTIVDPYVGHVNLFKVLQGVLRADATLVNGRTVHDERLHQISTHARQGAGAGEGAARRRHRRGRQARRHQHRRRPRRARHRHLGRAVHDPRAAARGRDPRDVEERRGQARAPRCTGSSTRTRRCASTATPRRTRRSSRAWARRTWRSRSSAWPASSASRSRPRTCGSPTARRSPGQAEAEGKVKKQSGGHGQFAVAWLRVEPIERGCRLRVRRQDRRRRHPAGSTCPRSRRACTRPPSTAACSATPSSTCASPASTASTIRSTAPRWRSRPRRRSGSRRRWPRPTRSCSSR